MTDRPTLDAARARLRAGQLAEAERILRDMLAVSREPAAIELLGATLGAQGRHAEALPCIDEALRHKPAEPALLYNRAIALLAVGRAAEAAADMQGVLAARADFPAAWTALGRARAALGDGAGAEQAFRQALTLSPSSPDVLYHFAFFLQRAGRLDEAIAGYRKALALNPRFANAHNNLGNALRMKGAMGEALAHYAEAAKLAPQLVEAVSNYGAALQESGHHARAVPLLEHAMRLEPGSARLASNLGVAYYHANRLDDSEACQRRALALDPDLHEARINLGNVLAARGRTEEAIACYREVVARDPANPDAQSNLGLALQERGDDDGAIAAYEKALASQPDHPDALNNLGFLLQEDGRRAEAIGYYERALAVNPRFARAEYNLGLAQLAERRWEEGWRRCEARFAVVPPIAEPRPFDVPRFGAGDIGRARRVAIWSEQGVGDQVLYATMLPELERRGVPFVLEADARLLPALRRAHDWTVVAPREQGAFAGCDRHIPIASLGGILRPDTASFEAQPRALLAADPARVESARKLREPARRLVGISWRSFQPQGRGLVQRRKSAALAEFMTLSRRDDVTLLDLQYGDTAAEREAFAAAGGRLARVEGLDLFNDLDGVFAAIEACDLVITTSNVTAHFAGALGKEAWLIYLASVPPFHYWSTDGSGRCLWYPSLRIVTGAELRTWPQLFERLAGRLA